MSSSDSEDDIRVRRPKRLHPNNSTRSIHRKFIKNNTKSAINPRIRVKSKAQSKIDQLLDSDDSDNDIVPAGRSRLRPLAVASSILGSAARASSALGAAAASAGSKASAAILAAAPMAKSAVTSAASLTKSAAKLITSSAASAGSKVSTTVTTVMPTVKSVGSSAALGLTTFGSRAFHAAVSDAT